MTLAVSVLASSFGTGGDTGDTGTVTPTSGSLLVYACVVQDAGGSAGSFTNGDAIENSGNYTFTLQTQIGFADNSHPVRVGIFTAPVVTGVSSVFSAGISGTGNMSGWVYQVTGQHASTPVGAKGTGFNSSQNSDLAVYTSTANNSLALLCGGDDNERSVITWASSDCTLTTHDWLTQQVHFSEYKNAVTPTSGSAVTANISNGIGSVVMNWAAIEIIPAASASFLARAYYDSLIGRVRNV